MTDIRKAVARAICDSEGRDPDAVIGGQMMWETFLTSADAAIAAHIDAIMEPKLKGLSDDFYFVLNDACDNRDYQAVWQAILTAMRNEK